MTTPDPWHEIADALVEIGEKLSDVRNGLKDLRTVGPPLDSSFYMVSRAMETKRAARRVVALLTRVEYVFRDAYREEEERLRTVAFKPERSPL